MYIDKQIKKALRECIKLLDIEKVHNPADLKEIVIQFNKFQKIKPKVQNLLNNLCLDNPTEHKQEILEEFHTYN